MQQTRDDRYFGSDLNKFINEKCTKEMSCINIDCVIFKKSIKKLIIIESKYPDEKIKYQQIFLLKMLYWIFYFAKKAGNNKLSKWDFNVWIVRGKPPYETANIIHPITNKTYTLNQSELIEWLEFRKELI